MHLELTQDWWNSEIKTLYDPCPYGYRIPASGVYGEAGDWVLSTWAGVMTAGHSFNKVIKSFFPASGYREPSNGKFMRVSATGYGWMSTPYNRSNVYALGFGSGYVKPNIDGGIRSYGFPIRCIIE